MKRAIPRWSLGLAVAALMAACAPSLSPARADAIMSVRERLLDHGIGEIARSDWPPAVASIGPERVYRRPEGVYICTWRLFVEERGVFILDPASAFAPAGNADPAYEPISGGLFIYRVAG